MSRDLAQAGLRRLIEREPQWAEWRAEQLRNRLLDEIGSDHRPLVMLLMTALDRGIPQRLPAVVIDQVNWDRQRASLASRLVSDLFIQPEIAAWAVETWALALNVIEERFLMNAPARFGPLPGTLDAVRATCSIANRSTNMPMRGPSPARATVPNTVSKPRTTGAVPLSPVYRAANSAFTPLPPWIFRAVGGTIAALLTGMFTVMTISIRSGARTIAPAATAAAAEPLAPPVNPVVQPSALTTPNGAPTSTNTPLASSPLAVTGGGLPATSADSAKTQTVTPPRRATFGAEQQAGASSSPVNGALDQVEMVDGRRLRGRVELIRAGTIQFREAPTGLRYEFSKKEIVQVTTEFGNVVRFDGSEASAPRAGVLVKRGLAGTYRVRYSVDRVAGTTECASLWRNGVTQQDRAVVRHIPGADTLQLAFVGGATFNAVLDVEARFASTFVIVPDQALTASALTSRLSGAFGDSGFTGQVNLIGYRRARPGSGLNDTACHSVLNMVGTRERPGQ